MICIILGSKSAEGIDERIRFRVEIFVKGNYLTNIFKNNLDKELLISEPIFPDFLFAKGTLFLF